MSTPSHTLSKPLVAIFPLQTPHANTALGLLITTSSAFYILRQDPSIAISNQEDSHWRDVAYWVDEDDVDRMTLAELDAYGDFLGKDGQGLNLGACEGSLAANHLAILREVMVEGCGVKFRRLNGVGEDGLGFHSFPECGLALRQAEMALPDERDFECEE